MNLKCIMKSREAFHPDTTKSLGKTPQTPDGKYNTNFIVHSTLNLKYSRCAA